MGNFGIQNVPKSKTIGLMEYFSYGIGDFSFCFIYGAIGSYIVFFYTDVACISAATVGTILLLSKIFDGISDMLMGYVIENVHSPLGKARPWLLWMAIPYCAGSALLFTVPDLGETGRVIYAFISYNLMATTIFTSMNVPYGVLSSVMTNSQNERSILSICRASFGALGVFLISSYAPDLVEFFGGGAQGWQRTFLMIGLVSIGLFWFTFYGCKERVGSGVMEQRTGKKSSITLKQGFQILCANKYWFIMLMVNIFYTAMTSLYGMNLYFAKYVIQSEGRNRSIHLCGHHRPPADHPRGETHRQAERGAVRRRRYGAFGTGDPDAHGGDLPDGHVPGTDPAGNGCGLCLRHQVRHDRGQHRVRGVPDRHQGRGIRLLGGLPGRAGRLCPGFGLYRLGAGRLWVRRFSGGAERVGHAGNPHHVLLRAHGGVSGASGVAGLLQAGPGV